MILYSQISIMFQLSKNFEKRKELLYKEKWWSHTLAFLYFLTKNTIGYETSIMINLSFLLFYTFTSKHE
uniref:Uncharacterized protein n=1 Tax=Caenorhabditis tropicalis TaxID=1561998 RepID=A0A1I7TFC4_9PELO